MNTGPLLPLALAFIMLSMGLTLVIDDFKRVVMHPLAVGYGLVSQLVLLPLIGFGLAVVLRLPAELAIGVMILAASPGGITSNLLTNVAGGDTALSVSLTAITSVASLLTLPLLVNFSLAHWAAGIEAVAFPLGKMVTGIFLISTLPLLAGMAIRHRRPAFARRVQLPARRISVGLFVMIVVLTFIGQWDQMTAYVWTAGPAVLLLNVLTMGGALLGALALGMARQQRIAIAIECGLQNAAMGIFVATTLLQSAGMVIPSVLYALVMNLSVGVFIGCCLFSEKRTAAVSASDPVRDAA